MNAPVDTGLRMFHTDDRFAQSRYEFDAESGTLWSFMRPSPRPSFTPAMLHEMERVESAIENTGGWIDHDGSEQLVRYIVFASDIPGVWNLGGDLATFRAAIEARDEALLREYGYICVRGMHRRHRGYSCGITTISLVQGDALGGGFEGVLASDIVVSEPEARFGCPEINFGLFPGMGGLTFLARRIGLTAARRIVSNATTFDGAAMHEMGIVDVLAAHGEAAVREMIGKHERVANGHRAIAAASRLVDPVSLPQLEAIVDIWAAAALQLSKTNLRTIDVLVRRQDRLVARANTAVEESLACA